MLLTMVSTHGATVKTLTMGVVPQFETRQLRSTWQPLLDALELRTGYRFELVGAASIPEFERQFSSGQLDFAYLNPYHMVLAQER